jgi:serine/threonine protein kinase
MLYTAPEMIAGEEGRYSRALDAWAVGATLLTAFTRKSVNFFRDATLDKHKLELATSSCPPALGSLIARLMAPRESRISIAEALESEWLMLTPRGRSSAAASRMWRRPLGTLDTSAGAAATS